MQKRKQRRRALEAVLAPALLTLALAKFMVEVTPPSKKTEIDLKSKSPVAVNRRESHGIKLWPSPRF